MPNKLKRKHITVCNWRPHPAELYLNILVTQTPSLPFCVESRSNSHLYIIWILSSKLTPMSFFGIPFCQKMVSFSKRSWLKKNRTVPSFWVITLIFTSAKEVIKSSVFIYFPAVGRITSKLLKLQFFNFTITILCENYWMNLDIICRTVGPQAKESPITFWR